MILALTLLIGCTHKTKATPPPAAQAPVAPVSTLAKQTPPPQLPPPELPAVSEAPANTPPPPKPHKTVHHKPKVETTPVDQAPAKEQTAPSATTEQAANGGATDMSPIGQLSAAGESANTPRRHEILDEINSTENTLNNIKRPLSSDEQTTATQIRTFLAKAKGALTQEDLDAAHSLVARAKVLLDELTKP
jgi:outer membrane biosynthesis protein TonB